MICRHCQHEIRTVNVSSDVEVFIDEADEVYCPDSEQVHAYWKAADVGQFLKWLWGEGDGRDG